MGFLLNSLSDYILVLALIKSNPQLVSLKLNVMELICDTQPRQLRSINSKIASPGIIYSLSVRERYARF